MQELEETIQELVNHFDMWPTYNIWWESHYPGDIVAGKTLEDGTVLELCIAQNGEELEYLIKLPSGERLQGPASLETLSRKLEQLGVMVYG